MIHVQVPIKRKSLNCDAGIGGGCFRRGFFPSTWMFLLAWIRWNEIHAMVYVFDQVIFSVQVVQ